MQLSRLGKCMLDVCNLLSKFYKFYRDSHDELNLSFRRHFGIIKTMRSLGDLNVNAFYIEINMSICDPGMQYYGLGVKYSPQAHL